MIDVIAIALIIIGVFFFFATTIGILRFPDFYSRMHAAGKGDTLSSFVVLAGLAIYNLHEISIVTLFVSLKIMFICVFIFMANPTATHHIIEAGYNSKVEPWSKEKKEREDNE